MKNGFFRGHGLGNDYVVMDPNELTFKLTPRTIQLICNRNWGLGSDGILALAPTKTADFGLRIYNPDGSEAEKSGNGRGLVTIDLHVDRHGDASSVTVEMGRATFQPAALPCTLKAAELIQQPIEAAGRSLIFTGVSVGNPHCVVFKPVGDSWLREDLLSLGPALEKHPVFPKRTNVQLAVPTGPSEISILIWERGAGETQASGSSSCAAASAAVRLGLVRSPVTVKMPGGTLTIRVSKDFGLTMKGPVAEVARGALSPSFVRGLK
jgi:diaminopimelate epimerase